MRALMMSCLAFCSLALSGCTAVYSVHPLNTKEDAEEEPAIEGTWNVPDDHDDAELCIQKADGAAYKMFVNVPHEKMAQVYQINLVRINSGLYADLAVIGQAVEGKEFDLPLGALAHHVIVKLDVNDDELTYFPLDSGAIEHASDQGFPPLEFIHPVGDAMLLTASTEDLRQYISSYDDLLFTSRDHFARKLKNDASDGPGATCTVPEAFRSPPTNPPADSQQ